jgi:hypothetical protein
MKNRLLALIAALAFVVLALAVPALAFPPQCSCGYCTLHGGTTTCTIVSSTGNTVVTCGYYYPHFCEGPA